MKSMYLLCALVAAGFVKVAASAAPLILYVSPGGTDTWSGKPPRFNAARTDGPLASLTCARDAVRRLSSSPSWRPQPITVSVHGGMYRMTELFVLTEEEVAIVKETASG